MDKFCTNCGAQLVEGADLCLNCGKFCNVNTSNNSKNRQVNNKPNNDRRTIVSTMIVDSTSSSKKKVGSTAVRGMVGGALLGPAGLVAGALSGKNKVDSKVTFLIEFADGHRETRVVKSNSFEFKNLCQYLKM